MVVEPWLEEPHTLCQKQSKIWSWLPQTMVCDPRLPNSPVVTNYGLDRNHGLPPQNCQAKQPLNVGPSSEFPFVEYMVIPSAASRAVWAQ